MGILSLKSYMQKHSEKCNNKNKNKNNNTNNNNNNNT